MRGGVLGGKGKAKAKKIEPYKIRKITPRDIQRMAYRQAGMLDMLPSIRDTPSDIERLLRAGGLSEKIAQGLTFQEQQELEADLSFIAAGKTSGTLPERLVAKWLVSHDFPYEGMGDANRLNRGFAFQVPLLGGRERNGGTVVDFVVSASASRTKQGLAIFPEGAYWHKQLENSIKDESKYQRLKAAGYEVMTLWDYEALEPGVLDEKMRAALKM